MGGGGGAEIASRQGPRFQVGASASPISWACATLRLLCCSSPTIPFPSHPPATLSTFSLQSQNIPSARSCALRFYLCLQDRHAAARPGPVCLHLAPSLPESRTRETTHRRDTTSTHLPDFGLIEPRRRPRETNVIALQHHRLLPLPNTGAAKHSRPHNSPADPSPATQLPRWIPTWRTSGALPQSSRRLSRLSPPRSQPSTAGSRA